jgi:hypothetical protein
MRKENTTWRRMRQDLENEELGWSLYSGTLFFGGRRMSFVTLGCRERSKQHRVHSEEPARQWYIFQFLSKLYSVDTVKVTQRFLFLTPYLEIRALKAWIIDVVWIFLNQKKQLQQGNQPLCFAGQWPWGIIVLTLLLWQNQVHTSNK